MEIVEGVSILQIVSIYSSAFDASMRCYPKAYSNFRNRTDLFSNV